MTNSRAKGKRGERGAADLLAELFPDLEVRRGLQARGARGEICDVELRDQEGQIPLWVEVKRSKRSVNTERAIDQATRDSAGTGFLPLVLHRQDHGRWLVTLDAHHALEALALDPRLRLGRIATTVQQQDSEISSSERPSFDAESVSGLGGSGG